MNPNSDAYSKGNFYQTSIYFELIDRLIPYLKMGDSILDIGSGDGKSTANLMASVSPYIGKSGSIVGLDILPSMVEYATHKYVERLNVEKKDTKDSDDKLPSLRFVNANIGGELRDLENALMMASDLNGPKYNKEREGKFDRVVSSCCIHWVHNQETAWKNIKSLLKPGGSLHVILGHRIVGSLNYGVERILEEDITHLSAKLTELREMHDFKLLPWNREWMPKEITNSSPNQGSHSTLGLRNVSNLLVEAGFDRDGIIALDLKDLEIRTHESITSLTRFVSGCFPDVLRQLQKKCDKVVVHNEYESDEIKLFFQHFINFMMEYNERRHGNCLTISIPLCYVCYSMEDSKSSPLDIAIVNRSKG